ncbi:MAG TPA: FG-GAP-like repeat-containing protein [Gemmataceae bacterium]|nr:FG-GAP-like repeat-containing protein [Gemmataceae bacterium]
MARKTRLQVESLDDRIVPSFSPAVNYAGTAPAAVATADFNNDGKLDLATAHFSNVSVRLGNGAGGFGAAQEFAMGWTELSSIAVADFNNDTRPDLAVAHQYSCTLFMGNGDGTFQLGVTAPGMSRGLNYVAVGDFNNDANTDLVITGRNADFLHVYAVHLGDGQGDFTYLWSNEMPGTGGLATVDLNNDGNLDVATADGYVLVGYGDGYLLSPYQEEPLLRAVAAAPGDFDGDGNADLVAVGDSVAVLRGWGSDSFHAPLFHSADGTVHTAVATADFNGDGKLDAVVANGDAGGVSLMPGNGDGTLTYAGAFATGASPSGVAVGDFNGDGRPDVAVTNAGSNTVSVLVNDGDWSLPPPPAIRIGDVTITEGNTGTRTATFTVTRTGDTNQTATVAYATSDGTATAGSDYHAANGTLTFAPGETSKTITVLVNSDRLSEPTETFSVNLSSPTNAVITDGQAIGTIFDDEPRISISHMSKVEGNAGQTTLFTFTVRLWAAYDQAVTVNYSTTNGTATGGEDYTAASGTLTFAPGETSKTITINVKGDRKREANETFFVDLFGVSSNATILDPQGIGTILNDD